MARDQKDQAIVPMQASPVPSTPVTPSAPSTEQPTGWAKMLDRVISVQRPVVVAHVKAVRKRHPNASPAEIIQILERQYLTAVTTGGAAVGASAVIPGVGMVAAMGLSGAETVGFLETTALFAQSVTEVHGITLDDPERARMLVMAMILGAPGTQLIKQLGGQMAGGQARTAFWGEMVTSSLPKQMVNGIGGKVRDQFIKRFATRQGTSMLGRALPFGIGAAVGGLGNHALGRKVIQASRTGFGMPPTQFPIVLEPSGDKRPGELGTSKRALRRAAEQDSKRVERDSKRAEQDSKSGQDSNPDPGPKSERDTTKAARRSRGRRKGREDLWADTPDRD